MDFIAEENRAPLCCAPTRFRFLDDLAHARDAFCDGAELNEGRFGAFCDDTRDRGFAGSGRTPEDDTADFVLLDQLAQRLARTEQMLLPDKVVECSRPHASGE